MSARADRARVLALAAAGPITRTRDLQRRSGLSRAQFAATWRELENAGTVTNDGTGWVTSPPRQRARRRLGVIA